MSSSSVANPHNTSHRRIHPNASSANLARHAAKCRLCNHPSRAAIEFDFLNWRNPFDLVKSYNLRSLSTIYRHAHATGLLGRRRLNLRFALERIVERVGEVPVTASGVIRCVRAITRMNDAGEWIDPPSRVIISREDAEPQPTRRGKSSRHNSSRATRQSQPPAANIFEPALLEEISHEEEEIEHAEQHPEVVAQRAAEQLREAAKAAAAPPEITIEFSPEFAAACEERRRGQEADRRALEAKNPRLAGPALDIAAAQTSQSLIGNETHSPAEPNG